MSRLNNLRIVNPVLTNLSVGYSNAAFVASALFPFANVEKEAGLVPVFGKDHFKIYSTERALRAKSNRMDLSGVTTVPFALTEHDIEAAIDYREQEEAAFPLQANATMTVTEIIRLRLEKMVADIAQNTASYASSNRAALSSTTSFAHANSDPEGVVDDAKAQIRAGVAKHPNTMVIGYSMWRNLKRHPKLKAILSDTRSRLVQLADLREMFEIENIVVGPGIYNTDAGVSVDIWGNKAVLAYVAPVAEAPMVPGQVVDPGAARSMYTPSFGYTLRKTGHPKVDTRPEDGKLEIIRATDIFAPFLLGADAGYLISDAGI